MDLVASLVFVGVTFVLMAGISLLRHKLFFSKQIERTLKLVSLKVSLPRASQAQSQVKEEYRANPAYIIGAIEQVYSALLSTYKNSLSAWFIGQKYVSFEMIAREGKLDFYVTVPVSLVDMISQTIVAQLPDAKVEPVIEPNIFTEGVAEGYVYGGELHLVRPSYLPVRTYKEFPESDSMSSVASALAEVAAGEGAAMQILLRPVGPKFAIKASRLVYRLQQGKPLHFGALGKTLGAVTNSMDSSKTQHGTNHKVSPAAEEMMKSIQEKASKPQFEAIIRLIASSPTPMRSQTIVNSAVAGLAQLSNPTENSLKFLPSNPHRLINAYILRAFPPPPLHSLGGRNIFNVEELATIYHFPNQFTNHPNIDWLATKEVGSAISLPEAGLVIGENIYQDERRPVRLTNEDKRRHAYIIGQTGTGKTTLLENMILGDIKSGGGVGVIDPHGDSIEYLLARIPQERANDVVVFDAGDTDFPIGLNMLEAKTPQERDFVIQELVSIFYKLFGSEMIGPRFEHWARNAALTLMQNNQTLLEIPKIFSDLAFQKEMVANVTDPTVRSFWLDEMAQTNDFHRSEMLGYFVSKFGRFVSNELMRNIIGQQRSSFDIRQVMDSGKIVLINLSKGNVGEVNTNLLGMVMVTKMQMAAMSRVDLPEESRRDFTLYIDEFQNFTTNSVATILSEARKYRLNLVTANQFIAQLPDEIREAVFGNVGSIISLRVGANDAEYLVKQFAPTYNTNDLVSIENFHAVAKIMINGQPSRPFGLDVLPPDPNANPQMAQYLRDLSRHSFGRPKSEVEREVMTRLTRTADIVAQPARPGGVQ